MSLILSYLKKISTNTSIIFQYPRPQPHQLIGSLVGSLVLRHVNFCWDIFGNPKLISFFCFVLFCFLRSGVKFSVGVVIANFIAFGLLVLLLNLTTHLSSGYRIFLSFFFFFFFFTFLFFFLPINFHSATTSFQRFGFSTH